jgi:cytochrome c553
LRTGARTRSFVCALLCGVTAAALSFTSAPAGSAAALETRLVTCLACHGEKGQSVTAEVPSLGGQPAFYLSVQMLMFRDRLRVVEIMNQMMQGFSNDELQKLADVISKLPPPEPVSSGDAARLQTGRTIAEQNHCNFCHQTNYSGDRNVPRIAGQREDYLVKALREYKNNTRRGYDASMADVLYSVTDEQILDLAYFLARQR